MKDFTKFDQRISEIESEHFNDLHQPLNKYFTLYQSLDDKFAIVWETQCPTIPRNKVIEAANTLL